MEQYLLQFGNAVLVITLLILILRRQDKRMDGQDTKIGDAMKKIEGQPGREYCDLQHKTVSDRFHIGDERFEKLESKMDKVQEGVSDIAANVAVLVARDKK